MSIRVLPFTCLFCYVVYVNKGLKYHLRVISMNWLNEDCSINKVHNAETKKFYINNAFTSIKKHLV